MDQQPCPQRAQRPRRTRALPEPESFTAMQDTIALRRLRIRFSQGARVGDDRAPDYSTMQR